ncbi:MAG: dTDP-glucose 4,6-dehydratase [Deltaproteobacteria bacterium]|nr:dTDP-glucose 4,6-dehydratase [Deltaproteobacteria bacterium]
MTILVTGGAGFIGTNFIFDLLSESRELVVNLDKLTYAGNRHNLTKLTDQEHRLVEGDIGDRELVDKILNDYAPTHVVNFAAESHVDRSIHGPRDFVDTNVLGTFNLLESVRAYFDKLSSEKKEKFRFLHVSTDEVYGSLGPGDPPFTENSPYAPNSPYSASKAASDHFVRAYHHTYGLNVLTTNCSNNYGPYQFPEKLIPLMILNALAFKPLPVYGDGLQIRDWLHVSDHTRAIKLVLKKGEIGQTYNIGGQAELANITVVKTICEVLDSLVPDPQGRRRSSLITYVKDRPGHDRRYAIDPGKIFDKLGFEPLRKFEEGLTETVKWYLNNGAWVQNVQSGEYRRWIDKQYGQN